MTGETRRNKIVEKLQGSEKQLSGAALAKEFQVSRQVIVQDIALLRAMGYDIESTNRGYRISNKIEENKRQAEKSEIGLSGEYLVYNTAHEIETTWTSVDAKPRRLKCQYCGCISEKDYGTCEHCGAPLIEEKDYK